MLILFGTRSRRSNLGSGSFFCPRCGGDRDYQRMGVRRWFTLFFIPVFPLGAARGVRVVCQTCNGAFDEQVLAAPTGDARVDAARRAFTWCATAVFRAGDTNSVDAKSALSGALAAHGVVDGEELVSATPDQLSVYVAPVAHQLTEQAREVFFGGCGSVALADGDLSDGEATALRVLGESLNLSEAHRRGILQSAARKPESAAG